MKRTLPFMLLLLVTAFWVFWTRVIPGTAQTNNLTITIISPAANGIADKELSVIVAVTSFYQISSITARVDDRETSLTYDKCAYLYPRVNCNPGYIGKLDMSGFPYGPRQIIATVKDVFNTSASAQMTFIVDRLPELKIASPLAYTVAAPYLTLDIGCSDDDPDQCTDFRVVFGNQSIGGKNKGEVSLAQFQGQWGDLCVSASDTGNRSVTQCRTIFVETSPRLREILKVGGRIWDIQSDRILFSENRNNQELVKILNRTSGIETELVTLSNASIYYMRDQPTAFLTANGAIFIVKYDQNNNYRILEWRNNQIADLSSTTSSVSLSAAGNYAAWHGTHTIDSGATLTGMILRDLNTGVSKLISSDAGNFLTSVTPDGQVVFSGGPPLFYRIYRYRNNQTSYLTNPTNARDFYPLTDGETVIFKRFKGADINAPKDIIWWTANGEIVLSTLKSEKLNDISRPYLINNGLVTFPREGVNGGTQVWLRSSDGQEIQQSFYQAHSYPDSLSPTGSISFVLLNDSNDRDSKRYVPVTGKLPIEVGSRLGRPFWADEKLYIIIGRSLFEFVPQATVPAITPVTGGITRQRGSAGITGVIATVSDPENPPGSLIVTATTAPAGITVTGIGNNGGTITATVEASCNVTAGSYTVALTVSDGQNRSNTANLTVNVTANSPPTLSYTNTTLALGGSLNVSPTAASDNGSIVKYEVVNKGTYTGTATVNSTGIVSLGSAGPIGTQLLTIRATDNCGATADASISITVTCPTIASLAPAMTLAGGGSFLLAVNGTGFTTNSVVRWNGANRPTTYVSNTRLTAAISAADIANSGTAAITVHAPESGGCTSVATNFVIQDNPRILRIVSAGGPAGGTVSLPIELVSQGNETALGFSLTFDPAVLSNPQATMGSDAMDASLNINISQVLQGRLGIVLSLSPGRQFSAGTRQIAIVTFSIAAGAALGTTPVSFGDQPVTRQVVDTQAIALPTLYVAGSAGIGQGFEADVSPRPTTDGTITVADWVQVGRFAVGVDKPAAGSEFQRADCAPRSTLGDGVLSLIDWVQAGRYAAGLDQLTPAGGPTAAAGSVMANSRTQSTYSKAAPAAASRVTLMRTGPSSWAIEIEAQGIENALAFSLRFDSSLRRFAYVIAGSDAGAATLQVNAWEAARGEIGFMLALPVGRTFVAGRRQALLLEFAPATGSAAISDRIGFADWPISRELADAEAEPLPARYAVRLAAMEEAEVATVVSAADFSGGGLARGSIVSAFGERMATETAAASELPLPKALGGTRVTVSDASGNDFPAPILYASPGQINFLLPAELMPGMATVRIASDDGKKGVGIIEITEVAPSLFAANGDGKGVAAALVVRVARDGSQRFEPAAQFDANLGRFISRPIDLGGEDEEVYLALFGTGWRFLSSPADVAVRIGDRALPVIYAGPQGEYAGLDQINVALPKSLSGLGETRVSLSITGKAANEVLITIQ